jgi:hypothetical protein
MPDEEDKRLQDALAAIGRDEELRVRFVALLRQAEVRLARLDFDVRESVTGPIVDALHQCLGPLSKRLASGIDFHFHYRSRIAREFVLAPERAPDHVWEPQTTRLLLELGRSHAHAVVCGASAGNQAVLLARQNRAAGGRVHCFEPDGEQLEMLRVNAAVNALENMQFNALALWDHGGREPGADPAARGTLDGYGRQQKIERIGLVMLDIGGAELAALRGAERYLGQPRETAPHLIFEMHRQHVDWSRGLDNTEICQYLGGFGYHLFAVRDYESNVPMGQQPIELIRPEETYLEGPPHGFNMLAVKEVAILANPAFRFVSGVSPKLLKHRDPKLHQPLAGAA